MNLTDAYLTNDALLLLQVEQGSSHAFDILYEKYWGQAYSNAYKRLKDPEQTKDIVQDVFINIWLKRETHIDNFPAYVNTAVRYCVFKLAEKQKKMSPFLDILEDIPATYLKTDANIRLQEFNKAYETLLSTLPPKRQIIFRLKA